MDTLFTVDQVIEHYMGYNNINLVKKSDHMVVFYCSNMVLEAMRNDYRNGKVSVFTTKKNTKDGGNYVALHPVSYLNINVYINDIWENFHDIFSSKAAV